MPAQFIMESIMEHVAKALNLDPTEVRTLNLYEKGQVSRKDFPFNPSSATPWQFFLGSHYSSSATSGFVCVCVCVLPCADGFNNLEFRQIRNQ